MTLLVDHDAVDGPMARFVQDLSESVESGADCEPHIGAAGRAGLSS